MGRIFLFGGVPGWDSSKLDTGGVSEICEMTPFVNRNLEAIFQIPSALFFFLYWKDLE